MCVKRVHREFNNFCELFLYSVFYINIVLLFLCKFTGKEFDTESGLGLFYFGARYYDPDLGVWTSTDPMDQYWNAYSYCGADPVNYVDEWGLAGENPGYADNPSSVITFGYDPGAPSWGTPPVTPVPSGPGSTIVSNQDRDDGPPTITSSYDNGLKDHNKDGKIDDKDVNKWFDEHDIPEEVFKKIIWKLQEDDHYVFAILVINAKKALDIYKTVIKGKPLTKKAARRDAMRKSNDPTSRPAIQQKKDGDNKQYVTEGADGKPRVQTHHKADKEHPNNHWHNAEPKTDPATGEILEGNHGEWKYKSGGTSSSYGN